MIINVFVIIAYLKPVKYKKKMKFISILLTLGLSTTILFAQESEKKYTHEMGVSAASLNSFGFVYRMGKNNSMWRASLLSISYNDGETKNKVSKLEEYSYGYRIALGKEFRKELHSKVEFRYGADLFYDSQFLKTKQTSIATDQLAFFEENNKIEEQSYGLNLVIGMNYKIKSNIIVGAEFNPYLSLFSSEENGSYEDFVIYNETSNSSDGMDFGFQSDVVLLTVVFRY